MTIVKIFFLFKYTFTLLQKCALKAGAISIREPEDQFYGDRSAGVKDQSGNKWWIATHKEDLSKEEIIKRMDDALKH
jgi:PhnB protein